MEIFTDIEKRILEKTNKSYKWIARDKNGCLYVYDIKPYKDEGYGFFSAGFGNGFLLKGNNIEHIGAITRTSLMPIYFSDFKKGTRYKGMKPEAKYTLKELGIEYNE